jgi:hypothetical protein
MWSGQPSVPDRVERNTYSSSNRYFRRDRMTGIDKGSLGSQRSGREDALDFPHPHTCPASERRSAWSEGAIPCRYGNWLAARVACGMSGVLRIRPREVEYSTVGESWRGHRFLPGGCPLRGDYRWATDDGDPGTVNSGQLARERSTSEAPPGRGFGPILLLRPAGPEEGHGTDLPGQ